MRDTDTIFFVFYLRRKLDMVLILQHASLVLHEEPEDPAQLHISGLCTERLSRWKKQVQEQSSAGGIHRPRSVVAALKTSQSLKQIFKTHSDRTGPHCSAIRLCSLSVFSSNQKKAFDFVETSPSDLPSFNSRSGFGMGFFARDSRGPSSGSLLILDGTLRSKREKKHHDFGHSSPVLRIALFCALQKPIPEKKGQTGTL